MANPNSSHPSPRDPKPGPPSGVPRAVLAVSLALLLILIIGFFQWRRANRLNNEPAAPDAVAIERTPPEPIVFGQGFWEQEASGKRWMTDEGHVKLWNYRQPSVLRVYARAPVDGMKQNPTIRVFVNGEKVGEFLGSNDPVEKRFEVPADKLGAGEWVDLKMTTTETIVPSERRPESGDNRHLGYYLYEMSWRPAKDEPIVFGDGFYPQEKTGRRWMADEGAVRLRNYHKPAELRFFGRAPVDVMAQKPTIRVFVNGAKIGEFLGRNELSETRFEVPAESLGAKDWLDLKITTTEAIVPSEKNPKSTDRRRLGYYFYEFGWKER